MTFSNPKVVEFIRANFVPAWINRAPGFHNEDYGPEQWIFTSSMEAYPTRNICTFFMAPDGRVFGYVAGSWCPEMFLAELEAARKARKAAFDEKMQLNTDGLETIRRVHKEYSKIFRERMHERFASSVMEYREFRHEHSDQRAAAARAGFGYLAALHGKLSEGPETGMWEQVRFDYLWGNSFTEEPWKGAPAIRGCCIGLKSYDDGAAKVVIKEVHE